jgi:tRNA modification GTPase
MDTICAISTPLGESGVGVIRISGPKSIRIADHIFKGKTKLHSVPTHTIHYGKIIDPKTKTEVDEAILLIMRKPSTYTSEDMVEINTHGSVLILKRVLEIILQNGARLAKPGEFTYRAFLSGRIDLIQAEAVLDIVKAKTEKSLSLALSQLDGKLSKQIDKIKDKLIKIQSIIEASIDFPMDVEEPEINIEVQVLSEEINTLLETAESGKLIREGIIIPIVGRTNVGKSTLFNTLLSEHRAIVTPYPGTTRDTIDGWINLEGIALKLIDTAGIRRTNNLIEREGVIRTKKAINEANLILFVFDQSTGIVKEDIELLKEIRDKKIIGVLNKCDLPHKKNIQLDIKFDFPLISISALKGYNINLLLSSISNHLSLNNISPLLTKTRHIECLRRVYKSLQKIQKENLTSELISYEIKEALDAIGEITGEVTNEEILDRIFSEFCIGK